MPAVAIPGASVPTHPTYFARARGGMEHMVNVGSLQPSIPLSSGWSVGGNGHYGNQSSDPYGLHSATNWPLGSSSIPGVLYASQTNQLPPVPNGNGWRNGDWMCTCGFHNYSSRVQVWSNIGWKLSPVVIRDNLVESAICAVLLTWREVFCFEYVNCMQLTSTIT